MSPVQGLVAALACKVDDSQVPSGETFDYPEIWTRAGNMYSRLEKLHFINVAAPSVNLGVNSKGYGAFTVKATPALADKSDITVDPSAGRSRTFWPTIPGSGPRLHSNI